MDEVRAGMKIAGRGARWNRADLDKALARFETDGHAFILAGRIEMAWERLEAELAKPAPSPDVIALRKAEAIAMVDRLQLHMATLRPIDRNDVTRITSNG